MAFSSSSSLFHLINAKGIVGSSSNYCMLGKWSARSGASWCNLRAFRTATTAIKAVQNQDSSPWLMLPPEIEGGTTSYKFYSLDDNKVQTRCLSDEIRDLRLTCRGSSHGWLALLSQHDDGFFLYNPITRRHIKLPSILNLPTVPYEDILTSARYVSKVILSCSPDEDEDNCRVLVLRDCGNVLAFCCPGRSKEWTLMLDEQRGKRYYKDCVHSNRLKLFFALTYSHNETRFETWDLGDLSSPKLIKVDKCNYLTSVERFLRYRCEPIEHLVVADEDLFLVTQYMIFNVGPDGLCFDHLDERYPDNSRHVTIRFDILKYDSKKGRFEYVDSSSLGGLAIFVGVLSHPVAIQATDQFPELKPDSIYFTDGFGMGPLSGDYSHYDEHELRGHDIGIYNYRDKTVSSCYYPCDAPSMKTITPPPIWFFPSRTI